MVTIPDSETNYLYELMKEQDWLDIVPASREGETFAIALGLLVAGKTPVVLIQNTGMMESGDSIRGMVLDAGFPLVMVVGYRGWNRHGDITDSAARYTEPFLNAFRHQLLPGGAERRQSAHLHGLRGSPGHQAAGCHPGGRRIPRVQPLGGVRSKTEPRNGGKE